MNKSAAVMLAEGFEEIEATTIIDVLRRGGVKVTTFSVTGDKAVCGAHGITVLSDELFSDAALDAFDAMILPGGCPGSLNLGEHKGVCEALKKFASEGKLCGAICAAPMVLGALGIVKGKKATIYPGMEGKLIGAIPQSEPFVLDGNVATGKGPGLAAPFALGLLKTLAGEETEKRIRGEMLL